MRNPGKLVTLAVAAGALAYGSPALADVTSTTTTNQTQPQQVQVQPVQTAPPPQVIITQPAQPVAQTTTTAAPYNPPGGEQYNEHTVEHRPNKTLLKTGLSVFIVSYAASAVAGIASTRPSDGYMAVPLVGPWIDLGNRDCGNRPCGDHESGNRAGIITAGVFQTAGALMAIGSFFIPESESSVQQRHVVAGKPEVHVTPVSFADGGGVGAIGRF